MPTFPVTHLTSNTIQSWKRDHTVRIVDANTLKLEKQGLVTLAGVQMPSPSSGNFRFPSCFDKSPSYKLRQLVPPGTMVRVQTVAPTSSSTSAPSPALIVTDDGNHLLVNAVLVESGFARVKEKSAKQAETIVPNLAQALTELQKRAQTAHMGIYRTCGAEIDNSENQDGITIEVVAEFEPLQPEEPTVLPSNPGDRRNCADFETYEEALRYYEAFFPFYGDVARLDRDNDGVPCPGLPHTSNPDIYRMKVPTKQQGIVKVGR